MNDIIYFELNDWSPTFYPDEEPFISYIVFDKNKDYYIKFRDINWIKENELVVVETLVDMSINFCVTAKREWVEKNCPRLLTNFTQFIRTPKREEKVPIGKFGCPFLKWSIENIGYYEAEENEDVIVRK